MAVSDWSTNADLNTSIDDIDISEHCPAKNMNDAVRAIMANVKAAHGKDGSGNVITSTYAVDSGVVHKTGNETVGGIKTFTADTHLAKGTPVCWLNNSNYSRGQVKTTDAITYFCIATQGDASDGASASRLGEGQYIQNKNTGTQTFRASVLSPVPGSVVRAMLDVVFPSKTVVDNVVTEAGTPYATAPATPATPPATTTIVTTGWAQKRLPPIGTVIHFAGSSAPTGFIVANGAAVSRTTYADLFAVIGTTYGTGDGSTTFNLPNLIDKFIQGNATVGTAKNAGLPNITGETGVLMGYKDNENNYSGAFKCSYNPATRYPSVAEENARVYKFTIDASRSSSIYGNSTTVQPPALTLLPCIKY